MQKKATKKDFFCSKFVRIASILYVNQGGLMKKLIFSLLVFAATTGIFFTAPNEAKADCEHYYETVIIGSTCYLIEYDCHGIIVNITELED